ncbi:MAG TPA: GNAT family N-acetyltransferase [Longimicrobiales bacterium]
MSSAAQCIEPAAAAVDAVVLPLAMAPAEGVQAGTVGVRRARLEDVAQISELLDAYARRGLVLPRTVGAICRHIREFLVAVEADRVVGCGALRLYSPVLAEVAALAVAEPCQGRHVGRRIVEALVEEARAFGIRRVFALTLQEPFFHRLGFRTVPMTEVPEKIAADREEGIDRAKCMKATVVRDLVD